jgi:acetyl-CoA C-acetyltransferase
MREAVIVSTARTGLAKSHRGGFNNTGGAAMAGHAIKHSIVRAGIDPGEVSEVVLGCGTPQGTTGNNIGRVAALKAGCPITTTGVTVSRHCSSGLNAIATAAGRIIVDGEDIVVGEGSRKWAPNPGRRFVGGGPARAAAWKPPDASE